ncbi:dTMP kinase [Polyangium aurulentum]|uniref:dTMP kinase n=1 Tax=Polyangium aurulentum TaxID=2567896 RepID=UPI0010AED567|nr:dTMP kinase [Polyangium aurulentum]UQA59528.1 dTMP kinase [Polyangium aurulentum]
MAQADDHHDGVFVVFEGIDGAGTTTQSQRYAAWLRARRRLAHVTREPSGGPMGSLLRLVITQRVSLPATHRDAAMALLFAADRLDHVESEINPHLRDGYVVISDRYDLSSVIYQSMSGADEGPERTAFAAWIRDCNRYARRPDVTVVLDVSPEVAAQRRRNRGGASELFEEAELQAKLARAYLKAEEILPGDRIVHVDGDADVDAVAAAVIEALAPFVKEGP